MENVYDLATYKKKKKKMMFTKTFNQYKVTLAFLLLFTVSSIVWWIVSFKVALVFTVAMLLVPFIMNGRAKKKKNKQKASMESLRNKPTMKTSLFKK
jgi:Flp pilus assembly protein TadB